MIIQEEIREAIDTYTDDACLYPRKVCFFRKTTFGGNYCTSGEDAYRCLMRRLGELGVVIKVDRELPVCACWNWADIATDPKVVSMLKAGYVATEPLIQEGE